MSAACAQASSGVEAASGNESAGAESAAANPNQSTSDARSSGNQTGQNTTATSQTGRSVKSSGAQETANRSVESSCSVSSSTNELALKLSDGRTLRLDSIGNERVQEKLRNDKKWSDAVRSGKPIQAKMEGVISGEKLVVTSVK